MSSLQIAIKNGNSCVQRQNLDSISLPIRKLFQLGMNVSSSSPAAEQMDHQEERQGGLALNTTGNACDIRYRVKSDSPHLFQPGVLLLKKGWDVQGSLCSRFGVGCAKFGQPMRKKGTLLSIQASNLLSQKGCFRKRLHPWKIKDKIGESIVN